MNTCPDCENEFFGRKCKCGWTVPMTKVVRDRVTGALRLATVPPAAARLCLERAQTAPADPVDVHAAAQALAGRMRSEAAAVLQERSERRRSAAAAVLGSTSPLLTMPAELEAQQRRAFIAAGRR